MEIRRLSRPVYEDEHVALQQELDSAILIERGSMEIIIALICVAAIVVWLFRIGIGKRSQRSKHIYNQPPASAPILVLFSQQSLIR